MSRDRISAGWWVAAILWGVLWGTAAVAFIALVIREVTT